jgi:tRNA pseudouridine38-40 synthase
MPEPRNYRMTVAYDGTDFLGYQIQREQRTVQAELEKALLRLTQQAVRANGAGRTDAGVHAHGQVVSFRAEWRSQTSDLERALNAVLPRDISVRELQAVDEGFHARFSATSREYLYRLYVSPVRYPHLDRYTWRLSRDIDSERLIEATAMLVGEADLRAFGQATEGRSTVRSIYRAEWKPLPCEGLDRPGWAFLIEANGFLRGMVRRIVGTLASVGLGLLEPEQLGELIASRDPARACAPAPACGLFFWRARYQGDRHSGQD